MRCNQALDILFEMLIMPHLLLKLKKEKVYHALTDLQLQHSYDCGYKHSLFCFLSNYVVMNVDDSICSSQCHTENMTFPS